MPELKRIYWTRLGLRLAFMATMVWLFGSAILSLMPQAADVAAVRECPRRPGFSAPWWTAS
jgi:chaperone required for assembly of F1-ATPase